jgi:hypothetical protein
MTKQDIIKKEYREYFELFSEEEQQKILENNGWQHQFNHPLHKEMAKFYKIETSAYGVGTSWRPLNLKGIEDNNGWNRIEDGIFPEDEETVLWLNNENYEFENASLLHCDFNYKQYTHWRKLPQKTPLY